MKLDQERIESIPKIENINIFAELYSNKQEQDAFLYKLILPYKFEAIFNLNCFDYPFFYNDCSLYDKKNNIEGIEISRDQAKIYTLHKNGNLCAWYFFFFSISFLFYSIFLNFFLS